MKRKIHIIAFICSVAAVCSSARTFGQCCTLEYIRPPFLHRGDTVAIVATSYEPTDSTVARSCALLRSWGFETVVAPNIAANPLPEVMDSIRHYAGDTAQRTEGLKWALENDSVKALICARGGYGAIQLIGQFPADMFRKHPKWLVGYSDVTTFLCTLAAERVLSIHGQMCGSLCRTEGPDEGAFKLRDLLLGNVPQYVIPPDIYNTRGRAEGILVGGNMITMAALLGTEYDPVSRLTEAGQDIILFIEEIDESMHAIDRLFQMLILHNSLRNVKGIVFGAFEDCDRDLPYESVEHMLYQYTSKLGIPVCYAFPAGHGGENMPLVEGAKAILNVTEIGAELSFEL